MNFSYDPRPRRPSRLAFHVSRIVVDAGALLVLGAMSLPFVTAEGFHQRAVAADGLPALLLILPVFLMTLIPDQSTPLPAPLAWTSLGLAAAALPYTVVKYSDASTLAGTLRGSVGIGARLLVMGTFVVLTGLVLGLIRAMFRSPEPAPQAADALPDFPPAAAPSPAGRPETAPRSRVPLAQPGAPPARRAAVPSSAATTRTAIPVSRSFPRWRRPSAARTEAPATPASPATGSPAPAPHRPPTRVPPRPRPTDPDTEPTLTAQHPVQPWWPDDLEDLFS